MDNSYSRTNRWDYYVVRSATGGHAIEVSRIKNRRLAAQLVLTDRVHRRPNFLGVGAD